MSSEETVVSREFCREGEFPIQTIHVHFYAPTDWTDDKENQHIHDAVAAEIERFRSVAQDLVNGIVPPGKNEFIRIGVQHH